MKKDNNTKPIPSGLSDYAKDLIQLQREFIKIDAMALEYNLTDDPLSINESKFLGKPFFPVGSKYPKDKNGMPMVLIAQINFAQVPKLKGFPSSGILQLYFPIEDWDMGSETILYHSGEDLQKDTIENFSFIKENDYNEMPIRKIHKLSFSKSIDTGNSEDSHCELSFGKSDYWDFMILYQKMNKKSLTTIL